MRKHFKETKHVIVFKGKQLSNTYLTSIVAHYCRVCSKKILCDNGTIYRHVKVHGFANLKEYCERTNIKLETNKRKEKRPTNRRRQSKIAEEKAKILLHLSRALERAPVSSAVASLCTFKCPECGKTYKSKYCLLRHFSVSKHVAPRPGVADRFEEDIVAHRCHICSQKVLCDRKTIHTHVLQKHQICSIREYLLRSRNKQTLQVDQTKDDDVDGKRQVSKQLGNLCKFSCHQCKYTSQNWELMMSHLEATQHGPTENYDSHVDSALYHKCVVCQRLVLCDNLLFSNHLVTHNLSLAKYNSFSGPAMDLNTKYILQIKSALKDIPAFHPESSYSPEFYSIRNDQTTGDVGNLSFFKCSICSRSDMSYKCLVNHCNRQHPKQKVKYSTQQVVEARYHKCHICDRIVLCDNQFLGKHLVNTHKMKMHEYVEQYVLKNGGRVFPTMADFRRNNKVFEKLMENAKEISKEDEMDNGLIQPDMLSSESEDSDSYM